MNREAAGRNREAMDDDTLIARLAGGDDAALRELFFRHAPMLAGRLRAALPATDIEDVLQETFLAVWRGAGSYRPGGADGFGPGSAGAAGSVTAGGRGSAGGWLWGIARRQAALLLRKRGPAALPLLMEQGAEGGVTDPAEAAATRADLERAVAALEPAEREVWRLMYEEDRPVAETATLTGVPPGTVKSRAHRARKLLRAALGGMP
jgi:RNA polymerase sigma-70 factor (ECF subfamily)